MPGADGVQILKSKRTLNTKYLYYYCDNLKLPNTGYNRHFKFLKESLFITPPLHEQRAIASVLSDMDAEIEALEAKRNKYTRIKQGMMQDLLTGRVRLPMKEI
jgi:type I restriction enzyme S subunit